MNSSSNLRAYVTLLAVTLSYNAWSQDSLTYEGQISNHDLATSVKAELPLYVIKVDDKTCQVHSQKGMKALDFSPDLIQSIEVLKGKNATDRCGTPGQFGVIIINMKSETYQALPRKLRRKCS